MARNKSWFLIIFVAAAWLRLTNLGLKSLWLDEAFAVWNANLSPLEIWQATYDNHPPLYYLLLHGWMAVLGRSEVLVRLPSVFNSMVGLALAYRLGRRLLGRDAAVAATLLALAPLDVWYAQEARMVSFVIPAALLLALGLSCLLDRPWPATLLIAVGLAMGLYFDYTIVPLWVGLGGVWLAYWGRNGRPVQPLLAWLAGSLAGWLAFAPLWPHLALVVGRYGGIFFFANLSQALKLPALTAAVFLAGMGLLAVGTAIGAWLLWRLLARPLPRNTLVVLAVAGFTLATLLAPVPRLYSLKRLVVTGWPFAVLLVTWLLARAARPGGARYTWLVWYGLFVVSLTASLASLLVIFKDDWRSVVAAMNQQARPGDVAWLDPSHGIYVFNYYQPVLPAQFSKDLLPEPAAAGAWHVAERQPGKPIPASTAERWLDENWQLIAIIPFYRLELRYYQPPGGG
ncbi:MAG: glycosyltransferase family 39 protein [Chloroflexi bacterium]|nr:glycosyltransferase family 39 protein [Chloroflexota bacterium]MCI0731388.1 glycosyltransferase family 39 protein [Chloroflexota bacterium]